MFISNTSIKLCSNKHMSYNQYGRDRFEVGFGNQAKIRRKSGRILAEPEDFQTDDNTMEMKMIINGESDLLLMPDSLTGILLKR